MKPAGVRTPHTGRLNEMRLPAVGQQTQRSREIPLGGRPIGTFGAVCMG